MPSNPPEIQDHEFKSVSQEVKENYASLGDEFSQEEEEEETPKKSWGDASETKESPNAELPTYFGAQNNDNSNESEGSDWDNDLDYSQIERSAEEMNRSKEMKVADSVNETIPPENAPETPSPEPNPKGVLQEGSNTLTWQENDWGDEETEAPLQLGTTPQSSNLVQTNHQESTKKADSEWPDDDWDADAGFDDL